MIVRAKLIRTQNTAAVCLSEAVSYGVLRAVDLPVADPYVVVISNHFSDGLSKQYEFADPVIPGRHWGTRLLAETAVQVELDIEIAKSLARPSEMFTIYVADEILANRDRRTYGNVLLLSDEHGNRTLLPIDQSDCFGGPDCLRSEECLSSSRDRPFAEPLEGMEWALLEAGRGFIDAEFRRVAAKREEILQSVDSPPDEWYDRAGVDPDTVRAFLAYRVDHIEELARAEHWRGLDAFGGDEYVLDI